MPNNKAEFITGPNKNSLLPQSNFILRHKHTHTFRMKDVTMYNHNCSERNSKCGEKRVKREKLGQ